jgi:hypothetical protein
VFIFFIQLFYISPSSMYLNTLLRALNLLPDGSGKLISGDGRGDPYPGLDEALSV